MTLALKLAPLGGILMVLLRAYPGVLGDLLLVGIVSTFGAVGSWT